MSDLVLTIVAEDYSKKAVSDFVKEYNSGNLTELGKKDLLDQLVFMAFLAGANVQKNRKQDPSEVTGPKAYLESET